MVSVLDEDGDVYYAQLRGFLQDQYMNKSAVITWLLPTTDSPAEGFDPGTFILGTLCVAFQSLNTYPIVFSIDVPTQCWVNRCRWKKNSKPVPQTRISQVMWSHPIKPTFFFRPRRGSPKEDGSLRIRVSRSVRLLPRSQRPLPDTSDETGNWLHLDEYACWGGACSVSRWNVRIKTASTWGEERSRLPQRERYAEHLL